MHTHSARWTAKVTELGAGTPVAEIVASFVSLRDRFLASVAPRTPSDARLVDQQLAIARDAARPAMGPVFLGAILVALCNAAWLPLWRVVTWPALFITVTLASGIYYEHLVAQDDRSVAGIARRARAFTLLSFVQVVMWCSMSVVLQAPGVAANQMFLAIALACALAGWTSLGTIHFATGVLGLPVYLIFMCVGSITEGQPIKIGIAVMFWALMASLFRANYMTRERLLRLQDAHGQLIDDLKAAKTESDRARERAETASRAKSAFLANMSHELRTPLNAILGFSEIIQTRALGPQAMEQYAEYGGYIHGSGQHLLALINDILDLAKIEAGRLTLNNVDVDLHRLTEDVVLLMASRAEAARLRLSIEIAPDFPDLFADERAVRQIFANLASNAVKFTPPGGRVTLFANVAANGELIFGVADTGVGIAAEDHHRVFESFGQGRHDAVLADHGTGLGLPIVKGLAEAMGGYVVLESTSDQGTRVSVALPATRARARLRAAS